MEIQKLNEIIVDLVKQKDIYREKTKIEAELSKYNLGESETIYLLKSLIDDNIFDWLDFICSKLVEVMGNSEQFVSLIRRIIKEIHLDLMQKPFVEVLIKMGEIKTQEAKKIFDSLISGNPDRMIYHYAGILLGGIGRKEDTIIKSLLDNIKNAHIPEYKYAMIVCAQIIFENDKQNLDHKSDYEAILEYATTQFNDMALRSQTILFAVEYFKETKIKVEYLQRNFEHPSPTLLRILVERIHYVGLNDHVLEFDLIEKAESYGFDELVNPICYFIASKNENDYQRSFDIVKKIILKNLGNISDMHYAIQEMGKSNYEFYKEKFIAFINETNNLNALYDLLYFMDSFTKVKESNDDKLFFDKMIKSKIDQIYLKQKETNNQVAMEKFPPKEKFYSEFGNYYLTRMYGDLVQIVGERLGFDWQDPEFRKVCIKFHAEYKKSDEWRKLAKTIF